jgi:hypothetical protein
MALAIRFDEMLRTGEVTDILALAQRGHVTQPQMEPNHGPQATGTGYPRITSATSKPHRQTRSA